MKQMKLCMAALLCLATIPAAVAQGSAPWAYEGKTGPANWARLDPAYLSCTNGRQQSPIDIRGAKRNAALPPIGLHYFSSVMKVNNDGNGIVALPEQGGYVLLNGKRYNLVSIHFHRPGLHAVKGHIADMSVEFHHRADDGSQANIEVRLNEGEPNTIIAGLWEKIPLNAGESSTTTDSLNPLGLFPPDKNYWTYTGSLETPPCTENVTWYVMQNESELSREQVRTFEKLYKQNSRPLQAPHDRKIEATKPSLQ